MEKIINELSVIVSKQTNLSEDVIKSSLEVSKNTKRADFTLQVAKFSRDSINDARKYYEALVSERENGDVIENCELLGSLIAIKLNRKMLIKEALKTVFNPGFGITNKGDGKTIVLDYSSPNIAKIFHAGHLRTTMIGNFIKNLLKANGYTTVSINYLGDWGKQFGFIGVGFNKYGNEDELKRDPIKHLFEIYVRMNKEAKEDPKIDEQAKKYFKELEEGKEENLKLWKNFRELSIEKYKELYKKLNVEFDVYSGESFYGHEGKRIVEGCGLAVRDDDGSLYFDLEELGKFLVLKADGSTLYSTRDIACAIERIKKYKPEKIIYVVASQQDLHFKQLFRVMKMLGYDENIFQHVNMGMVNGMSTRRGTVVFLEDIIETAKECMLEAMKSNESKFEKIVDVDATTEALAVSAMIIQDFSAKRIKGYDFNMSRNTASEGETGPYLQYTHCRLASIEAMNPEIKLGDIETINSDLITEENLREILFYLLRYPSVIEDCLNTFEPCKLVTYLMKLAKLVNGVFSACRVMGREYELARARLAVFCAAKVVLGKGMEILGMIPLKRM
ncbi:Arginine--tRNA ligase [Astathelohania contejeani]|uniref:arginine--tRNA ligase n=1 Tax=Astathelohania contejeani TaxID=164912 RepID=A0ABQ7I185_9MICR|nr:Arginine--tRNA ligase [Thelohania contejeani]